MNLRHSLTWSILLTIALAALMVHAGEVIEIEEVEVVEEADAEVVVEEVVAEKPAAEKPATEQPATEKPAEKPKDPAATTPATDKPQDTPTEEEPERVPIEVHHWGVWMADPALDKINAREHFLTAMPISVETNRPRRMKNDKKPPSPLNVVTFYGEPVKALEVDLRVKSGAFVAHWPAAQIKSSRLRWPDYALLKTAPEDAVWISTSKEHWFSKVRNTDALVFRKGARTERFMTYDFEATMPLPLKVEGGPDTYNVRSTANYPLHDLVIVVPTESGRRIGWLNELPAAHEKKAAPAAAPAKPAAAPVPDAPQPVPPPGAVPAAVPLPVAAAPGAPMPPVQPAQPAKPATPAPAPGTPGPPVAVALSQPLAVDSEDLKTQSTKALSDRLEKTGLKREEIDLILSLYGPTIFGGDSLIVAWRIPSGTVEEVTPMTTDPETTKLLRVVLVVARNLDPKIEADLQTLVDKLGSPQYKDREAAEERLIELGSLAFPTLKKALTNTDPEIAHRVERLLVSQNQPIDIPNAPK